MVNRKQKGKDGEDEACDWLSTHLYRSRFKVARIHNQSFFGADAFSKPFIWEFKRQETLSLNAWWIQIHTVHVKFKALGKLYIPVVMFRQNYKQWEFLISSETIGVDGLYIRLNKEVFLEWASTYI
jgi:hypothetical protein